MKVFFIVKPINDYALKQLYKSIEITFDKKKDSVHILKTSKKEHAIDLTQKAIEETASILLRVMNERGRTKKEA